MVVTGVEMGLAVLLCRIDCLNVWYAELVVTSGNTDAVLSVFICVFFLPALAQIPG